MNNAEKYDKIFMESFSLEERQLDEKLLYESVPDWDSIGHMGLISEIENIFKIEMETDDIIELSSYNKGKEIIKNYGVDLSK